MPRDPPVNPPAVPRPMGPGANVLQPVQANSLMPSARQYHGAVSIGDQMYLFGGLGVHERDYLGDLVTTSKQKKRKRKTKQKKV
mgnify:CR=1 FL=1